jgi:hypothetical protein
VGAAPQVNAPQLVFAVGAHPQVAGPIKAQTVGAAGWLAKRGEFPVRAIAQNTVVGLVGEEHVAAGIAGRAFGELETASQFLQLRA